MEKRKKPFSVIEDVYLASDPGSFYCEDRYGLYCRTYYVHNITVDIHNEEIGEAIQFIMPHK